MIDEKYFDILNKVIDNTATLKEKQSLTEYIKTHPEELKAFISSNVPTKF